MDHHGIAITVVTVSITGILKEVRGAIKDVLNSKYAVLGDIVESEKTLTKWTGQLRQAGIIDKAITRNPTYHDIIDSFTAALPLLATITDIEAHCQKFIDGLRELGGPATQLADTLREKWRTAARDNGYNHFMGGMYVSLIAPALIIPRLWVEGIVLCVCLSVLP